MSGRPPAWLGLVALGLVAVPLSAQRTAGGGSEAGFETGVYVASSPRADARGLTSPRVEVEFRTDGTFVVRTRPHHYPFATAKNRGPQIVAEGTYEVDRGRVLVHTDDRLPGVAGRESSVFLIRSRGRLVWRPGNADIGIVFRKRSAAEEDGR